MVSKTCLTSQFDFNGTILEVLRLEDVIVERARSYLESHDLLMIDDLQSIFEARPTLNLPYLISELSSCRSALHHVLFPLIPPVLKRVSREIEAQFGPFLELRMPK